MLDVLASPGAGKPLDADADTDAAVAGVEAVDTDVEGETAPTAEAEPIEPVADAVDLRGYGAYGNTPTPGSGMTRDELVNRYAHLVKYVVGRLGVSVPGPLRP